MVRIMNNNRNSIINSLVLLIFFIVLGITFVFCSCQSIDKKYPNGKYNFDLTTIAIPQDVIILAISLPSEIAINFYKDNHDLNYLLSIEPPSRVKGYNSRMDNLYDVEGAKELDKLVAFVSNNTATALILNSESHKVDTLQVLSVWAEKKAFMKTVCCTQNGKLINYGECTEWKRKDGQDLSGKKDFTDVQMGIAAITKAYYTVLYNFKRKELLEQHKIIEDWLTFFNRRMKKPTTVYFGLQMGWHWPAIINSTVNGNFNEARYYVKRLRAGLNRLILKDGSMKDRTTRGDRALWYHNSALNETIYSMELMRATNIEIPQKMEVRLHKAVKIFLESVDDYSVIDKWAKKAHNSTYEKNYQSWKKHWRNNTFGGSWWHIYQFRYPENENSKCLADKISINDRSAFKDKEIGIGLGCIYNAARKARSMDSKL
jgi:hypothetical protein